MSANEYTFLVGKILGFHGLSGEVKLRPETNNPELLLGLKTVRLKLASGMNVNPGATLKEFLKLQTARLEKKMLLLTFKDHDDRTSVEYLEGAQLFCKESDLLPLEEDEFWVRDLVGLDVYTTTGEHVGKVVSIIYGGNDLLEVQRESDLPGKTVLIPFVQDIVPTVSIKTRRIEIVEVPGLLEAQ